MKIIIKNTGAAGQPETILADGGSARGTGKMIGPDGLRIVGAVNAQIAERLRADNAKVYNRENARSEISFRVWREFNSDLDAEYWLLRHAATVQREDTLYMYAQASNGNTTRVTVSNCVLTLAEISHQGVSVFIAYQITGGAIS